MLPNPFQKPLTEFKDTDPLKNREIVRELLGPEGVHKYRKILGENLDVQNRGQKNVSREELLAMAAEARKFQDAGKTAFEKSLEEQYETETRSLEEVGLLETNERGVRGITAIDSKFYALPSKERIQRHFAQEKYREKINQGFTKLLIVPFGYSLKTLQGHYRTALLEHAAAKKLFDSDDNLIEGPFHGHWNDPVAVIYSLQHVKDIDDEEEKAQGMVYYPEIFNPHFHNGKTKEELLAGADQPFPGFNVLLIKPDLTIHRKGDIKTQGNRTDIESQQSIPKYLEKLQTDPQYRLEQGFTLEDQIALSMTQLQQTNKVIDDYENGVDSFNDCIGAYFSNRGYVPYAGWSRKDNRVILRDVFVMNSENPARGVRLAVA